jgi:L-alanine-DL-glutamate epimerase-like enolase superfamily enzyme
MTYRIEAIELYVRETQPGRMAFSLGKQGGTGDIKHGVVSPLGHVRLILKDSQGNETFGCSADRLSVRWLDKRPGRSLDRKRRELADLIHAARDLALKHPTFDTPFDFWRKIYPEIQRAGRAARQVDLTSAFASALMERAVIDAVSRLENRSVFQMVRQNRLGIRPAALYPELQDVDLPQIIPAQPRTRFFIRHTIGSSDPLTSVDVPDEQRINDGLPETLQEYVETDGVRYFKVKVSGDADRDLERLAQIWDVIVRVEEPVVTLDANEAFTDLSQFARFVERFESELLGMFQHVAYIEQPLPRDLTLDRRTSAQIRKISQRKPLIIDEADGTLRAYDEAHSIGYAGTSHKNCKGFFKSLLNLALAAHYRQEGRDGFLSGEDLQNLPVVPLHQDFAALGVLNLAHCERNGHHYNYGLSMLSEPEKDQIARRHRDLYVHDNGEWFLNIRQGKVDCASLQCPGFGVAFEPDWTSMTDMQKWVRRRHPRG